MQRIPFSSRFSRNDLIALSVWAGCHRGRRRGGFGVSAVSRLAGIAARNGRSNHYHHAGHFAHVIIAAAVLAVRAGIGGADRELLVLAALVHDLDHHGRRGARYAFYRQERLSARMACRLLMRRGGDARMARRLERLIVATALTSDPCRQHILSTEPLAGLLSDADVFASLFYDRDTALKLTCKLKLEKGIAGNANALLDRFATRMRADGLKSEAARLLLHELTAARQSHRNVVTGKGWA